MWLSKVMPRFLAVSLVVTLLDPINSVGFVDEAGWCIFEISRNSVFPPFDLSLFASNACCNGMKGGESICGIIVIK